MFDLRNLKDRGLRNFSILALTLVVGSCSQTQKNKASGAIVSELPATAVVAEYEGGKITAGDLSRLVEGDLKKLNEQALEAYREAAQRHVLDKVLESEAKKKGLSGPQELMQQVANSGAVSEAELKDFIKQNKLDQPVRDPKTGKMTRVNPEEVRQYLVMQKSREQQQSYVQGLLAASKLKIRLEEPREVVQDSADFPSLGAGPGAKVVIHEFSDFQCPFCARGANVLKQIHSHYGDKVRLVFRHFPLDFHQEAKPAAIAAICSGRQNKFWEMHDKIFENQQNLNRANFISWATQIGLDRPKFEECLNDADGSAAKLIDADMQAAQKIGVNSTPTFFVNGKRIAGALPFENFKALIDEELAK